MTIVAADFEGKWAVGQAYGDDKLNAFIDKYRRQILVDLMGVELFEEYENDDAPFADILAPMSVQKHNQILHSIGLKTMLLDFIYSFYINETQHTATSGGTVVLAQEGGNRPYITANVSAMYYNDGFEAYRCIQAYLKANFENFKGVKKELVWNY
jgi:hypothetical protein